MSELSLKLSAYLDQELPEDQLEEIRHLIETDPKVSEEFERLAFANDHALSEFDDFLEGDTSQDLISMIENAELETSAKPLPQAVNNNFSFRSMAAGIALLIAGGIGGFVFNEANQPEITVAQTTGWLHHVADYHGIYAQQKRHLVEVGADEADHIVGWLSNTTGLPFSIPDITNTGFEFQGARLLVVKGKPVAQLMYKDQTGSVVAICFQSSSGSTMGSNETKSSTINGFDILSWSKGNGQYLVIGEQTESRLKEVADQVKLDI